VLDGAATAAVGARDFAATDVVSRLFVEAGVLAVVDVFDRPAAVVGELHRPAVVDELELLVTRELLVVANVLR